MARVDIGSMSAKPAGSGPKPAIKAAAAPAKSGGGLSAMDSKQKMKLAVAVGLLLVAGVVIAIQLIPSGGSSSGDVPSGQTMGGGSSTASPTPPPVPGKPKGYVPPDPPDVKRGGSRTAPGVPRRQGGEQEPPK